jgi:hypothetical protein
MDNRLQTIEIEGYDYSQYETLRTSEPWPRSASCR